MSSFLVKYLVGWLAFSLLAIIIAVREVRFDTAAYWASITSRWGLAIFVPAIAFVSIAGQFTDDETWDFGSGFGMSVLTFLTSSWAIGTLYKVAVRERPLRHAVVAVALMFFSSSWFYDGYMLIRDGAYTSRWWSNLMISPLIYFCAGLVLNFEARGRWVGLAFTQADWPHSATQKPSWSMALVSLPLLALAAYGLVGFVRWRW